ncbi:SLOG family protein [Rhodoblastus sp.]|uniref:SLOG family protein n=1 Tax=Rhodoblastus sp. TaxID=1962975 RepID=UPI003F989760
MGREPSTKRRWSLRRKYFIGDHHTRIWATLGKVPAKRPNVVLLEAAGSTGVKRVAACWADNRKVAQIAFNPDCTRQRSQGPSNAMTLCSQSFRSGASSSATPARSHEHLGTLGDA